MYFEGVCPEFVFKHSPVCLLHFDPTLERLNNYCTYSYRLSKRLELINEVYNLVLKENRTPY